MKIFLIFGLVLLIKQSLGETENTLSELSPNGKAFRDAVIAELITLSEEPIELGKKLFQDAYADKTNSANITQTLGQVLIEFERVETKKPAGKIDAFLGLGLSFAVFGNNTDMPEADRRRDNFFALQEAPEKHNVKSVANEFQRKYDEFFQWLTQEFEARRDELTSEEKLRAQAFKELWRQFKDEINYEKKKDFMRAINKRVMQ